MRHAARARGRVGAVAMFLAAALRGVERFVDGDDDVGHRHLVGAARQAVAAARAADRFDDLMPAQLAEQLFQVGQGNRLALADAGQGDRSLALAQGKIDHRCHGKTAFCSQTHTSSVNCSITGLKYCGFSTSQTLSS